MRRALPRWKEARTRTHNVLIYKAFWLFEGIGWDVGIRTPISASRARCPTVERRPSRQAETPIITRSARRATQPGRASRLVVEASPEIPAGHRPVRLPRSRQSVGSAPASAPCAAGTASDRVDDAEIADRQDVRPMQPEHQEHLRRPAADPFHVRQRRDDLIVRRVVDRAEIEPARPGRARTRSRR